MTVFEGDKTDNVPMDEESFAIWKKFIAEDRIILGGINTMPGGLLEVAFEVDGDMKTVLVPVLTSGQPEYNGLAPKNVITISK